MATDFPVTPVDRLPIFADEACSAAILMEMVQGGGPAEVHSGGGSRWGIVDAGLSGGGGFSGQRGVAHLSGAAYGEQTSVDAGGGPVSDFNESEGDNADAIEQEGTQGKKHPAMDSVIADQAESGDAASAHSTGKMDPQAPGWTRRVRVGKQPPCTTTIFPQSNRLWLTTMLLSACDQCLLNQVDGEGQAHVQGQAM